MSRSSYRTLPVFLLTAGIGLAVYACKPESPTGPGDNQSPTASITSPGNGSGFELGESISFEGGASDPEDGFLTGASLVWTSSLDGQIGTGIVFSRSDLSAGTHTIRLIAIDSDGAADTATISISVGGVPNQDPTASFSFSCSNLTCTFTDGSTDPDGSVVAWAWQFGDGTTSEQQSPQHTYATAGTFDVVLAVTDDRGATDDVMRQVSVTPQNQGPTASFTVECDLLECTFTDASTDSDGTVEAWNWSFGDGATSDQQNPQHTYASGGSRTVTLTVTDNDGATGQAVQQVTPNEKPVAGFITPPLCTGWDCQFVDTSTDPDGSITSWSWSFGDGATSPQKSPSHTYAADGDYEVRLIVTDNRSAKDTITKTVSVLQPNQPPVAAFSSSCDGLSCDFTDESTDDDGNVVAWAWDFGDGATLDQQSPSHTYAAASTYTVTLTVTDNDGAESDPPASREISVSPANQGPTADFTFSCVNLVCQFTDGSSDADGTIDSRSWDFGDGDNSSQTDPQHAFAAKDDYTVSLEVTDNDGATGQISKPVSVNTTPTTSILQPATGASFNKGTTVQFQGSASDGDSDVLNYLWESNLDGTLSAQLSFTSSNLTVGVHTISFSANDGTAADTSQVTITIVNQAPTVSITTPIGGSVFNLGSLVGFSGTGTDPEDGILTGASFVWTSDLDGPIGSDESFTKSDLTVGSHLIRLVATDSDGATDTASVSIRINAPPTATITAPDDGSTFTVGKNIVFRGTGVDPEDGSLSGNDIVWISDINGEFGTGSPTNQPGLSVGTHVITFIVTDSDGATGTDQITVTVNQSPTATIIAPSQDTAATQGDTLTLSGTGFDPEDGPLTELSLQWESSEDGNIGSGVSVVKSDLTVGTHTIRLIATDSQAAVDTATVAVTIVAPANQPPTAAITAPSQDTTATQGDAVTFTGTGFDPEDGPLTELSLQWESNQDGNIGSGVSVVKSDLTVGVHTIRLIATDSQAAADTAEITITVNPAPGMVSFATDIQPYFTGNCTACHGASVQMGAIRLDSYTEVSTGSNANGPLIVAGNSADATAILLPQLLADHNNGPDDSAFSVDLAQWIDDGAADN